MADTKYIKAFEIDSEDYLVKDEEARSSVNQLRVALSTINDKLDKSTFEEWKASRQPDFDKLTSVQYAAKNALWADWDLPASGEVSGGDWALEIRNKPTTLSAFIDDLTDENVRHHHQSTQIEMGSETLDDFYDAVNGFGVNFEYGDVHDVEDAAVVEVAYNTHDTAVRIPLYLTDLKDSEELNIEANLRKFRDRFGLEDDLTPKTPEGIAESLETLHTGDVYDERHEGVGGELELSLDYKHWTPITTTDPLDPEPHTTSWEDYYKESRPNVTQLFNRHLSPINTVNKEQMIEEGIQHRPVEGIVLAEELEHYLRNDPGAYYEYTHVGKADEALSIAGNVQASSEFSQRKTGNVADVLDYRKQLYNADVTCYKGHIASEAEYISKIFNAFPNADDPTPIAPFIKGTYWNVTADFHCTKEGRDYKVGDFIIYNGYSDNILYNKLYFRQLTLPKNAFISSVRGNSIVWNQLLDKPSTQTSDVWFKGSSKSPGDPATVSAVGDGLKITVPANSYDSSKKSWTYGVVSMKRNAAFTPISTHIYYMRCKVTSDKPVDFVIADACGSSRSAKTFKGDVIQTTFSFQHPSAMTYDFAFRNKYTSGTTSAAAEVTIDEFMLVDLTLMFGLGKEPDTNEFMRMFPSNWYDKNEGEIINLNLTDDSLLISGSYNVFDGLYAMGGESGIITAKLPVIPYQQYVFQWPATSGTDTGGIKVTGYYDPDGSGAEASTEVWSTTISAGSFVNTGYANCVIITIPTTSTRTVGVIKAELRKMRFSLYNAYNGVVTDTEYWHDAVQILPEGETTSLRSSLNSYDELTQTLSATRVGRGTIAFSNDDILAVTCTWTDGDPSPGKDYICAGVISNELGEIEADGTIDAVLTKAVYPHLAGKTFDINYRLASQKSSAHEWNTDWTYIAGYCGSERFYPNGSSAIVDNPTTYNNIYESLSEDDFTNKTYSTIYPLMHGHTQRLDTVPQSTVKPTSAPFSAILSYDYDTARSVSKLVSFPDMRCGKANLVTAPKGQTSVTTISYGHTFENVPMVFITPQNNEMETAMSNTCCYIANRSRSAFNVIYHNNSASDHNTTVCWFAFDGQTQVDMPIEDIDDQTERPVLYDPNNLNPTDDPGSLPDTP